MMTFFHHVETHCGKGLFIRHEKIKPCTKLCVCVVFVSCIGFAMQKCTVVVLIKKWQFTNKNKFNNKYGHTCAKKINMKACYLHNCLYLQNKNATRRVITCEGLVTLRLEKWNNTIEIFACVICCYRFRWCCCLENIIYSLYMKSWLEIIQ